MPLKGISTYLSCPVCDADVPISEDEKVGDEVYCTYCQVPLKLRKTKDKEDMYLEENF